MPRLGLLLLALAPFAVFLLWHASRDEGHSTGSRAAVRPPAAGEADPYLEARVSRLEQRLEGREQLLARLSEEVEALRRALHESFLREGSGEGGVAAILDQYVMSFGGGANGSEYFRLAVDAHAVALLPELLRLLSKDASPAALRIAVAHMLGSPRFAGNRRVADALLGLLGEREPAELQTAALKSLWSIAGPEEAGQVERALGSLKDANVRAAALGLLVRLYGDEANRALRRLYAGARTDEERSAILDRLSTSDVDAAMDLLREASHGSVEAKRRAAKNLARFRGDPARRLVEERLAAESDPATRKLLEAAKAALSKIPNWDALRATGQPDAIPPDRDHPTAWAAREGDMGMQWLEVAYKPARRASMVRIFEVNVSGGVRGVETVDLQGRRRTVWKGIDPTERPGVFELAFEATAYEVQAVRIHIDTDHAPGWEEIDAVELVGPDGRAWATAATASSTYGQ